MKAWLKRLSRWLFRQESGQSLLVIIFAVTALIGAAATVTDLGTAYVKTAQTQTAVDAAVLASGMTLPIKSGDTTAIAT